MNQMTLDVKKNFLSRTFSRCLAEMCPGVVRLEYHLHDDGDEVAIIRSADGNTRRVDGKKVTKIIQEGDYAK